MLSFDHGKENTLAKNRFIKFIDSEEADFLLERYPNAFLLLALIAKRARRTSGHIDGLEIGDAHIGDHKSCGLTERQYRTAKEILCKLKIIRIKQTCRKRQKSTTESTTVGTLVTLLDSRIFDINSKSIDDRIDDRPTTDRRPTDDEQECKEDKNDKKKKEKIKKEKSSEILKTAVRENVFLTEQEHSKLLAIHGQSLFSNMLDILESYKGSNEKTYKSDFHVMKPGGWVYEKALKNQKEITKDEGKKLWKKFKHGETYDGETCYVSGEGISFVNSRGESRLLKFQQKDFDEKFEFFINSLGIKI